MHDGLQKRFKCLGVCVCVCVCLCVCVCVWMWVCVAEVGTFGIELKMIFCISYQGNLTGSGLLK